MSTPENSASRPEFIQAQYAFAGHIRDPERQAPPPGLEDRRMAVYRELFFNNIENFLSGNFPVLRSIVADEPWESMIRDFLIKHRCQSPYFTEIGVEFLDYLKHERIPETPDPAFLYELAHYERVELDLSIASEPEPPEGLDPNGDLLSEHPIVSPLARNLSYRFPVHRIGPDHQPRETPAQPSFLLVYRGRDEAVHFLEINAATAQLVELLQENPGLSGLSVLKRLAEALRHPEPEQIVTFGLGILTDLRQRHIISGTLPP